MKHILNKITREAMILLIITLAVSFIFNFARRGGIPLIADAEAFRVRTVAEFIKIDDAHRLFEEGRAIFVDARDPESFSLRHIEGAINTSASGGDLEGLAWLADADTYVISYASEQTQRQAGVIADKLIDIGCSRDSVFVLLEGFDVWERKGLPTQEDGG